MSDAKGRQRAIGLLIGRGVLVAAGALVSRDVPDHAIVAGNPARIVGDVREQTRVRLSA